MDEITKIKDLTPSSRRVNVVGKVVVLGEPKEISPIHTCAYNLIEKDSGLALRFPRLIKIRDDKKPEDATTTKEIIELFKMQKKTK